MGLPTSLLKPVELEIKITAKTQIVEMGVGRIWSISRYVMNINPYMIAAPLRMTDCWLLNCAATRNSSHTRKILSYGLEPAVVSELITVIDIK